MIIDSPSKSPTDVSLPFPIATEASSIQKSGDSQTGNFYMKHPHGNDEPADDTSFPPAVICRFGEDSQYDKVLMYDKTGRLFYC